VSQTPVKVTVLASTLAIGGAEQLLLELLRAIDRERFDVDLAFLREPGPIGQEAIDLGYPWRENALASRLDPSAPFRLARILRERGTEVLLIINHLNALTYGVLAAKLAGTPAVVNWHNETHRRYRLHWLTMRLRRVLHMGVDAVVAAARGHKDYIVSAEGVPPGKVTVIYNGVDLGAVPRALPRIEARRALGVAASVPVCSIVAALRPDKNHESFLRAASLVLKDAPEAVFLIVGDGPRQAALEELRSHLGLGQSVRFLGFRRDVPDVLAATDVIALSSHPWQETLSVAMLEAMAGGIPAVVPDVGFLGEIVKDGVNGYLVPPNNPELLADRIKTLMLDAPLRARMGAEAAKVVALHCGLQTMTAGFERLFLELAARPR
jgi:glycosyltransferase involved in cell wall biosynthesis